MAQNVAEHFEKLDVCKRKEEKEMNIRIRAFLSDGRQFTSFLSVFRITIYFVILQTFLFKNLNGTVPNSLPGLGPLWAWGWNYEPFGMKTGASVWFAGANQVRALQNDKAFFLLGFPAFFESWKKFRRDVSEVFAYSCDTSQPIAHIIEFPGVMG